jgi:hypothetical protein
MTAVSNEWALLYLIFGLNLIAFLGMAEFLRHLIKVIRKISHDVSLLEVALDSISSEVSDINVALQEIALGQEPPEEPID